MSNVFATNLIYLRGERNLTQQELGDVVGVSPSQISRYEAGTARPRKTVLGKLAAALGVAAEVLDSPLSENISVQGECLGAQMRAQLQELVDLVKQDEQYTAAVAYGAIVADHGTTEAHHQRAARIVELKRNYGLT